MIYPSLLKMFLQISSHFYVRLMPRLLHLCFFWMFWISQKKILFPGYHGSGFLLEHRYFFAGNLRRINCSCDPSDDPSVKSSGKKYTSKTSTDKETSDRLRRLVHPFILRRLKKDVLKELPDKIEKVVSVHLEGEQKKLYDAYAQRLKLYLAKQSPHEKESCLQDSPPQCDP